jgi:DNA-binding transcriptional ArsR family regulator
MSIAAMSWAFTQKLPPAAKLVLLALADHSDDQGKCWPGVTGVSDKTGLSRRSVQRHIRDLESCGLIRTNARRDPSGRQVSSLYFLACRKGVSVAPRSDAGVAPAGDTADALGGDSVTPESSIGTVKGIVTESISGKQSLPVCPLQQIVEFYHEILPEKRHHTSWDGARRHNLEARWRWLLTNVNPRTGQPYFRRRDEGLAWFRRFFEHCRRSRFLMEDCRVFCLEWAVKKGNFHKILEGAYHDPDTRRNS